MFRRQILSNVYTGIILKYDQRDYLCEFDPLVSNIELFVYAYYVVEINDIPCM